MNLQNNTILITGGNDVIGKSLAIQLSKLNKVLVCGRNKQTLDLLKKEYPEIETYQCDLTKESNLTNLAKTISKNYPNINILINNAGIIKSSNFNDKNFIEEMDIEFQTNFYAPVKLTHLLLPLLQKNKTSAIVNIGSLLSYAPVESKLGYCASKAALHSFTKALRFQLENTNIKVLEVFPPAVNTKMASELSESSKWRILQPDIVAKQIIKGMKSDKKEIRIGLTKIFYYAYRFFPSLVDLKLKRS